MCQLNSQSINSVCTSWNKGVRRILNLPHDARIWFRTQNSELRILFNIIQLCNDSLDYIRYKSKMDIG